METEQVAHRPHPNYVAIFVWLTIFTVIEVALSYIPMPDTFKIGGLVTIAVIKAALVVLYYMHLRYDSLWYTLILLIGVFFAVLIGWFLLYPRF